MLLLNIGLSGFSLQPVFEVDNEFLINEVLVGASLMTSVRQVVTDYYKELSLVINYLKRHMMFAINISRNEINSNTDQINQKHIRKCFSWFEDNVINASKVNNCNNYEKFEDGGEDI